MGPVGHRAGKTADFSESSCHGRRDIQRCVDGSPPCPQRFMGPLVAHGRPTTASR